MCHSGIYRSAWKGYSANFAFWVFSEVLLHDHVLDGAGSGLAGGALVFLVLWGLSSAFSVRAVGPNVAVKAMDGSGRVLGTSEAVET
jgi:hypothetical protein